MKKTPLDHQKKPVQKSLTELTEACLSLEAHSKNPKEYKIHYDAVVKRFEVLFEYTWKLLKAAAEFQGMEAPGPRPAIQEAVRFGWIEDPEFWAEALSARNGSVHDYYGISEREYLKIVKRYTKEVSLVLTRLPS